MRTFSVPGHSSYLFILLSAVAVFLVGCGPTTSESSATNETVDEDLVSPEEYYAAHPDFFHFASPEDLPSDLTWEDGMDQPTFASPEAVRGGTLRSFILNFPPTVRYVGPDSNHSFRSVLLDDNAIGLVTRHPVTSRYYAALASEWAVSPDKKTVYFKLRPEVTFSDGEPVTTEDFLYLFYFMQSPHIVAPWYNDWYSKEYDGITRYDDQTFAIHLSTPKPEPLEFAGVRPVPAHFHGTLGPDWITRNQWQFEPTTGPYELLAKNIRNNQSIRMTRVKDWWADNHKFYKNRYNPDSKYYELVRDINIAFERFKKGDFDIFGLTLPEYWYERSEGVDAFDRGLIRKAVFYNQVPRPSIGLWINSAVPGLDDVNIRKGIQHSMNFDRVIDKHYRGDYFRLNTSSDGYGEFTNHDIRAREFSIEKAREYFAQAGYTEQGPDGILRTPEGDRLSFTLLVSQGPRVDVAQILKEEARKAGLEINILSMEPTSAYKQIMEKQHQITFSGWSTSLPYPRYWEGFHSANANIPQTNNITNTANPGMDALIDAYRASTDLDQKREMAHQLEEMVYEDAAFIPGYKVPFYRVGYWAWIHFPESFDVPLSDSAGQYGLFWIDLEEKKQILKERKGQGSRPNEVLIFDEWKDPS
ncbi:MAG: extracellular solute-binding protein [Puniceicoccales bacterium]